MDRGVGSGIQSLYSYQRVTRSVRAVQFFSEDWKEISEILGRPTRLIYDGEGAPYFEIAGIITETFMGLKPTSTTLFVRDGDWIVVDPDTDQLTVMSDKWFREEYY